MAGPEKPQAGYVMRAQATDDGDYGVIIDLIEAVQELTAAIEDLVLAILDALSQFASGDFGPGQFESLQTIQDQQQEHLDAVNALAGGATVRPTRLGFQAQQFASPEEFLTALSEGFDKITALYAGVVPAVDDAEARTTLMSVASVANRHAAVVNNFAGVEEFPNTFQPAELPEV